jgi:hypothetical protein
MKESPQKTYSKLRKNMRPNLSFLVLLGLNVIVFNREFGVSFPPSNLIFSKAIDLGMDSQSAQRRKHATYLAHATCRSGRSLSSFGLQSSNLGFQLGFFDSTAGLHLLLPVTRPNS